MTLSAPPERDVKPMAETKLSYNKKKKKYVTKKNITKNTVKIVNFYTDYAKYELQYSSNKNFKDAKTITKSGGNVKNIQENLLLLRDLNLTRHIILDRDTRQRSRQMPEQSILLHRGLSH